jgi:hypothetical protein
MNSTIEKPFHKLLLFLGELEQAKIWYRIEHVRNSMMVIVAMPGERWEVEFFEDGEVEVERFLTSGKIEGEGALKVLRSRDSDDRATPTNTGSGSETSRSGLLMARRPIRSDVRKDE